jgi:hypothetical protein
MSRVCTGQGYPDGEPLGAGVEGAIYRIGAGMVAKVWGRRREREAVRMQNFYAGVARAGLPFASPVILRVAEVNGAAVTFERELHGEPLQKRLAFEDRELDPLAVGCLFGQNILVDEAVRPTAVLDFGFLSTAGDPRLDASISAVIMNIYGPRAPAIARALTDRLGAELGYPAEVRRCHQSRSPVFSPASESGDTAIT